MKINPWYIAFVIGVLILIPVQKIIDNRADKKETKYQRTVISSNDYHYKINVPDTGFILPAKLDEISGLSTSEDTTLLAAVDDEKGWIYLIGKNDGILWYEYKFGKAADYEGIEVIGNTAYVVESNGNITRILNYRETPIVQRYKTYVNSDDDVEGLATDLAGSNLLLACKATQSKKNKNRKIYRFRLNDFELDSVPFLEIDNKVVNKMMGNKPDGPKFSPSAIAVHPHTGDMFMISSVTGVMIVLKPDGSIIQVVELDKSVHRQPEGLTFDHHGVMYISNEARDEVAKLYVFSPSSK